MDRKRFVNEVKCKTAKPRVSFKENPMILESIDVDHNLSGGGIGQPKPDVGGYDVAFGCKKVTQAFQPVSGSTHRLESLCHTPERCRIVIIGARPPDCGVAGIWNS